MKTFIEFDDENFDGQYCHAAHVKVINDNSVIQEKYVDIKELLKSLSKSTVSDDLMHRIGNGFLLRFSRISRPVSKSGTDSRITQNRKNCRSKSSMQWPRMTISNRRSAGCVPPEKMQRRNT